MGCLVVVRLCCLGILCCSSGRVSFVCLSSGFLWLVVMVGQGQRSIDTDAQARRALARLSSKYMTGLGGLCPPQFREVPKGAGLFLFGGQPSPLYVRER